MITEDKIREVALRMFSQNGYSGTSLADISAEVGIKKQSIYHHFKNKDDLFISIFVQVAQRELLFVENFLLHEKEHSLEKLLYSFLIGYKKRYEEDADTKFYLRNSFFPPDHIKDIIIQHSGQYLNRISILLKDVFDKGASSGQINKEVSVEYAANAFEAILDAVFVEMLYVGVESSLNRLDASWYVFWRGIKS